MNRAYVVLAATTLPWHRHMTAGVQPSPSQSEITY